VVKQGGVVRLTHCDEDEEGKDEDDGGSPGDQVGPLAEEFFEAILHSRLARLAHLNF